MKIALFSDIHANLPALQAMFADMENRKPDAVFCLGDLVGYNIWPNEVIREIRKRNIPTIAGNYDYGIGRSSDDCGCAYKTDHEKDLGKISISYTNSIVQPEERQYLLSLPAHIRLEFQIRDELIRIMLVHGSPRKINEYLFEDRDEKSLLRIIEGAETDILCFGHTHKPFHRKLVSKSKYVHAINIGSVGKPKDGNPRGCYAILTIDENSSISAEDKVKIEFIRFTYDVEKAARAIELSTLPDEYADMLRKAY